MKPIAMNERFPLRGPRSFTSLSIEDAVLTLLAYMAFYAWHTEAISFLVFQVLMLILVFRVFNIRHEKAHLPHAQLSKLGKWLITLSWVFHTPYQEPYLDKRRKHLAHHKGYLMNRPMSSAENPHSLLEQKSYWLSILSSVFYEEVMFYQDWKFHRGLSESRRKMLLVSTAALLFLWTVFGTWSVLGLFISYRVSMAIAWFSFSKLLHIEPFHSHPLLERLPRSVIVAFELVLGPGAATGLLAHQFRHRVPLKFHHVLARRKLNGSHAKTYSDDGCELAPLAGY